MRLTESTELTSKEIEVLRLICDGLEYEEIADKLNITERTVKYHVSNILSKTGYANRTRLAIGLYPKFCVDHKRALSEICQPRVHLSAFGAYS